jgi:hypothetical protein
MSNTTDDVTEGLDRITPVPPNETVVFGSVDVPRWRPVDSHRPVAENQDDNVPRTNATAAQPWDIAYEDPWGGRWTMSDILIELFKARLGLPTKAAARR